MKRLFSIILFCLVMFPSFFMAQGWKRQYYFPGIEQAIIKDVFEAPDGRFIMAGISVDTTGFQQLLIACADNLGNLLWHKKYGDKYLTYNENPYHIRGPVLVADNGFYYARSARDSSNKTFTALLKFNFNGDTLWQKKYREPPPRDLIPQGMAYGIDSSILITGISQSWGADNTGRSCFLLKTDLLGNELWRKMIVKPTAPEVYSGCSVVQDRASKRILIVGYQYRVEGSNGAAFVLDSLGNLITVTKHSNPGSGGYSEVIQIRDGNFLISSQYNGNSDMGGFARRKKQLVKLDLNGDSLWSRLYDTISVFNWNCVLLEQPNGDIMMGGHMDTLQNYNIDIIVRVYIYRTDALGHLKWRRSVGFTNSHKSSEYMRSMNRTKDGGFIIAACPLLKPNPMPFTIIKIDSNACDSSLAYCELKLGLPEDLRQNLSVYPVPCDEILRITNTTGNMSARLYNLKGVLQKEIRFETMQQEAEINTTSLTPGVYLLQLQSGAATLNRKVIIEH